MELAFSIDRDGFLPFCGLKLLLVITLFNTKKRALSIPMVLTNLGLVERSHASVYGQLGEWVRNCYGSPLAATSGSGMAFTLTLEAGSHFDRIQLQEDIVP